MVNYNMRRARQLVLLKKLKKKRLAYLLAFFRRPAAYPPAVNLTNQRNSRTLTNLIMAWCHAIDFVLKKQKDKSSQFITYFVRVKSEEEEGKQTSEEEGTHPRELEEVLVDS